MGSEKNPSCKLGLSAGAEVTCHQTPVCTQMENLLGKLAFEVEMELNLNCRAGQSEI